MSPGRNPEPQPRHPAPTGSGARRRAEGRPARSTPTVRSFLTDDNHVLYHLWTLICALAFVVPLYVGLLHWAVVRFQVHFLYQPTGLGIVSATTLANYPIEQEVYYYVLALAVLMVAPAAIWLAWLVFSLLLSVALGRDFGTVATRGTWALSLFIPLFPYALLYARMQPEVTFALSALAAVAVLVLQVALVLALPQRFDFELGQPRWPRPLLRFADALRPYRRLLGRGVLRWGFAGGTVGAWALYLGVSLGSHRGEVAVAAMTVTVLALPVLFLVGWVLWCQRSLAEAGPRQESAPLRTLLVYLLGVALTGGLYWMLVRAQTGALEVLLGAVTVMGLVVARPAAARWLGGRRRWQQALVLAAALGGVGATLALVTFEGSFIEQPPGLDPDFLREDGSHLAWADALLDGKLQGRDFYSMYGPLLHYGLVAVMKVVGVRAEAAPLYWWLGRALGAAAAAFLLWELTGSALFSVLAILVLHTGVGLRTAAALAALAAFIHFFRNGKSLWALVAGLLAGTALAVSQEFALSVLVAYGLAAAVLVWRYETRRLAWLGLGWMLVGVGLALLPVGLYLAAAGTLGEVVRDLVRHPHYVLMGYSNLPYPNPFGALAQGGPLWQVVAELLRGGLLAWFFPILVWVVTLHLVVFRYVMGKASGRDLGALAVLVFGVLAYRTVLARSDILHLRLVMPVAVVLFLWHLWLLGGRLRTVLVRARLRVVNVVEFGALVAALVFLADGATLGGARVAVLWGQVARAVGTLSAAPRHLRGPSQIERATIPPGRTSPLAQAVRYVRERTGAREPILAVPNIPALYFLTDRPNPTRFVAMAQLVTNEHRVEAFRDLQRQPPSLVLFHGGPNNIDNIPPSRQFPNVLTYILTHYGPVAEPGLGPLRFGPIYVLERRRPREHPPEARPVLAAPAILWEGAQMVAQWRPRGDLQRVKAVAADGADVTYVVEPGNRPVTLIVDLSGRGPRGQAYRTLRLHLASPQRGDLRVSWLTREPLDAQERTEATLPIPFTGKVVQAVDLDLRDYPSWLFNHARRLSVTVPAPYALTVKALELLPLVTEHTEGPAPSARPADEPVTQTPRSGPE